MTPWGHRALAAAAGAAGVLTFAPFHLYPLTLLTFALLTRWWREAPCWRAAAGLGFAFGLGHFLAGVSWVYVSLHTFGAMPAPLAALATFLFCALLACFPAGAGALFRRLSGGSPWRDALVAAGAWVLTEWSRTWVFTGFPWLALGYAHAPPSPLAGFAPLLGVFGVSFAAMLAAAWLGLGIGRGRGFAAAMSLAALCAVGYGLSGRAWTYPAGAPVSVSLLQGNIEQSLKWRPELLRLSLATYLDLARKNPAQIVVLPETALPLPFDAVDPAYLEALATAAGPGGSLLMGVLMRDSPVRYTNSALTLGAAGGQRYDKSHLVPFGEFVPPGFAWTLSVLHIPMSDFTRGAPGQAPMAIAGQRVAPNICYEDVFGAAIAAGARDAGILVNLSNTAWFGRSLAQAQHLQIAQLRALETGRPMLRATNTGMTAVVGPDGRVQAKLDAFTTGALLAQVQAHQGATPYMGWGDAAAVSMAAAALLLGLARRRAA